MAQENNATIKQLALALATKLAEITGIRTTFVYPVKDVNKAGLPAIVIHWSGLSQSPQNVRGADASYSYKAIVYIRAGSQIKTEWERIEDLTSSIQSKIGANPSLEGNAYSVWLENAEPFIEPRDHNAIFGVDCTITIKRIEEF